MPLFIFSNPSVECFLRNLLLSRKEQLSKPFRTAEKPLCWTRNQLGKAFEKKDKPEDLPQEYASMQSFRGKR